MHLQGCGHTWRLLDHSTSSSLRHLLLLSLALREQMGLLALSADFRAHQPRGASEYSKGRPLLESLSLGIQQKGKRRANAGQDPRALCVKSYWWEKHALGRPSRRRVVAMANNPPEAGRAGAYVTAQHARGIRWTEILADFAQPAQKPHLHVETELFVLLLANKMSFQQHLAGAPASVSLSWYFLGRTEAHKPFSFQPANGRSATAHRGQGLCLQPQRGLHYLSLSCRSQFSSFTLHTGSRFG